MRFCVMMLSVYLAAQSHSPRGMPGGADAIAVPRRLQSMWVGWPTEGVGGKKLTPSPSAPSFCIPVLVPLSPALRVVSLLLWCVYAAGWLARTFLRRRCQVHYTRRFRGQNDFPRKFLPGGRALLLFS